MGKHLQRDLDILKKEVLTMGSMVEDATNKAINAFVQGRHDLAEDHVHDPRACAPGKARREAVRRAPLVHGAQEEDIHEPGREGVLGRRPIRPERLARVRIEPGPSARSCDPGSVWISGFST